MQFDLALFKGEQWHVFREEVKHAAIRFGPGVRQKWRDRGLCAREKSDSRSAVIGEFLVQKMVSQNLLRYPSRQTTVL